MQITLYYNGTEHSHFKTVVDAAKNMVNFNRTSSNGWTLKDDLGIEYFDEDIKYLAQL